MTMAEDVRSGDAWGEDLEERFQQIFEQHYRVVVSFFTRRGFSAEESRDLAQDTFLRVYKGMEGFEHRSRVDTWLFQIATNLYRNTLRGQSAQKRWAPEVSLDALPVEEPIAEGLPDWSPGELSPLASMLTKERERILREALDGMPAQMRRCVLLRVDQDLKYREIAELMRVSIETVKAHLYQARQHLKDKLAPYFTGSFDL